MQANRQLSVHCIHYTHYLFISLFIMHPRTENPNGLHDRSIVFDIPDHIWGQLNQGKEVEISVSSQPMSGDSSEQKAVVSVSSQPMSGDSSEQKAVVSVSSQPMSGDSSEQKAVVSV